MRRDGGGNTFCFRQVEPPREICASGELARLRMSRAACDQRRQQHSRQRRIARNVELDEIFACVASRPRENINPRRNAKIIKVQINLPRFSTDGKLIAN